MQDKNLVQLQKDLNQICSTPVGRRAFLYSLPVILAGCSSTPTHRHREGDNSGQHTHISVADEQAMSREYMPQMLKEYPRTRNSYAQKYIQNLGANIAESSGLEGKPYHYNFTVVDAKMVNAFALPAGEVFVTVPLIKMAQSEAELAGVVGHEIGHIKARHTAERIAKAKKDQTKGLLLGLGGAILGGAAGYALGRKLCKKEDRECLRRISLYGAAAGGAGGLLIQKFAFMANSREDEMEADRIGFKSALTAGFHAGYVGNFYSRLLAMEKKSSRGNGKVMGAFADALSTHPPSEQRVAQQRELSREFSGRGNVISSREFKRLKRIFG